MYPRLILYKQTQLMRDISRRAYNRNYTEHFFVNCVKKLMKTLFFTNFLRHFIYAVK